MSNSCAVMEGGSGRQKSTRHEYYTAGGIQQTELFNIVLLQPPALNPPTELQKCQKWTSTEGSFVVGDNMLVDHTVITLLQDVSELLDETWLAFLREYHNKQLPRLI